MRVARWSPRADAPGYRLEIAADRFLHHMVRMIVATLVEVGLDRRPADDITRILERDYFHNDSLFERPAVSMCSLQRQPWAAMEWLLKAAKQDQRRLRVENLLPGRFLP